MSTCLHCDEEYTAQDEEAGTAQEFFCSPTCLRDYEIALSAYIELEARQKQEESQ